MSVSHCKHDVPLEKKCLRCLDEGVPPLEKLIRSQEETFRGKNVMPTEKGDVIEVK